MDQDLETLRTRVNEVRAKLDAAAQGRPYTLLAASKTQSAETINLLPQCGIFDYGEKPRAGMGWRKHEKNHKKSFAFTRLGGCNATRLSI